MKIGVLCGTIVTLYTSAAILDLTEVAQPRDQEFHDVFFYNWTAVYNWNTKNTWKICKKCRSRCNQNGLTSDLRKTRQSSAPTGPRSSSWAKKYFVSPRLQMKTSWNKASNNFINVDTFSFIWVHSEFSERSLKVKVNCGNCGIDTQRCTWQSHSKQEWFFLFLFFKSNGGKNKNIVQNEDILFQGLRW